MRKTFYLTLSVFIFLGAFMFTGNVLAAEDVTAPQITSISISPSIINTSAENQDIKITLGLTDDLSGVCYYDRIASYVNPDCTLIGQISVTISPLIGTQSKSATFAWDLISGDANNGIYEHTITIPKWSKSGIWQIDSVYTIDALGNNETTSATQLRTMFPNTQLTFANIQDDTSVTIEKEWEFGSSVAKVKFPIDTIITSYSGNSFEFYKMVNQEYDLTNLTNFNGAVAAIRMGIPNIGLNFSQLVEIAMYIDDSSLVGENLLINTLNEEGVGASWAFESFCTVDIDQYCTFTVDHASLFMAQEAPVRAIVTGTKAGGGPEVRVFDTTGTMSNNFNAYENTWWGGINVAVGDIDGDGNKEIITSTRIGGIPTIKVFDINGVNKGWDFDAYAAGFRGGISLAVGDIEGDGIDEIVVAPMSGGGPNIRTFGYRNGSIIPVTANFMAYAENFRGGISVSIGDLEGDGIGEIITSPISAGGPHVRVFGSRNGVFVPVTLGVMAYAENFRGGITTTTADLNGNGKDEIVTGIFSAGGPHVRAIGIGSDGALALSNPGFMAFNNDFRGGVSVAALDTNGNGSEEIIAGVGGQDVGWVKIMSSDGTLLSPSFAAYGSSYTGGITLAAGVF